MNGACGEHSLRVARAGALVEHYQKTFELALRFWERRNSLFLILIAVLALAAILSVLEQPITTILTEALQRQLGGDQINGTIKDQIKEGMPQAFNLTIAALVVAIFYLTANLYHRTGSIMSLYVYLAHLENSIRHELEISGAEHAFSREGDFYRSHGFRMSRFIGLSYKFVLGLLLLSFFALRI
jgi:hypothetical protein